MNLHLTDEQHMLQDAATRLFAVESTPQRVRAAEASTETPGFDPELWQQVVDLGFSTLRMPEPDAPAGMGLLEAVLLAEVAGTHLASVPLAEAVVAARLLALLPGAAATDWQTRVRNGALVVLAPVEWQAQGSTAITGGAVAEATLLLQGDKVLLVSRAHLEPRATLGAAAVAVTRQGADATAPEGAQVLAQGTDARAAFLAAIEEWKLLNAAQLVGCSAKALALAAAYAGERKAFDKFIGSFQGIAHPLADALSDIESARLLVWRAVWSLAHQPETAAAAISMAWWWAAQAAARATAKSLRTFGGYGVSLEYDIQLYYRRARAASLVRGDTRAELKNLAQRLWAQGGSDVPLPQPGPVSLAFGLGARAQAFAQEARQFFDTRLTPELRAHAHHSVAGFHSGFNQQLAQAGLLYPHWPAEYGGRGRDPFDLAALALVFEDYGWQRVTAPVTNQVAQIVMNYATEEVKQEVLPRFASGEALACLGFSEPSCGSDVFAAKTKAVRDGDHWVINGQKIFTTAGNLAHYIFLLARTDPDAVKHKGLSLFLVPMNTPGVSLQPVYTIQDERTNITFFDNVRIPDKYRVGAVHGGLAVMSSTLELEHGSGDHYRISYEYMVKQALKWAQQQQRHGRPLLQDEEFSTRLAAVVVRSTAAEVLCHRAIWGGVMQAPERGYWGPMSKVFSTEMYLHDANELMDLAAPDSLFRDDPLTALIELGYRQSIGMTIYGGTSEIQRSLVAEQGLGLPRSRT